MLNYILLSINIANIFQDYGFIITVFLIVILIAYMMINSSAKRIKEQEDKIDSLYTRLDDMMKKIPNDDHSDLPTKFMNFAENANKIQIQMYHLLQIFDSERISIYEFHNGGKNLSGIEFKKCSNTYEAVSLETKPIIKEMQNMPLSINPLWNRILATREEIYIPVVADLKDYFLKDYLTSLGIKTYYSTILEDYDNTPIGLITMEYYYHTKELTKEQFEEFAETAIKIAVLINKK